MHKLIFILFFVIPATLPAQEVQHDSGAGYVGYKKEGIQFFVSGSAGFSWRAVKTAENIPSFLNEYYRNLKSGWYADLNTGLFFNENLGAGLFISLHHSKASLNDVCVTDHNNVTKCGVLSDNIRIACIGPTFNAKIVNDKNNFVFGAALGFGYMDYRDESQVVDPYLITGSTLASMLGMSAEFKVSENFMFSGYGRMVSGVLTKFTIEDGAGKTETIKVDNPRDGESLLHLNFGGGITLYLPDIARQM